MLYNAVGIYVLVVSLLSVFVIVLVARQGRTQKDVSIWLISGLVGILLGAAGAGAVVQALGYELAKKYIPPAGIALTSTSQAAVETGMPTGSGMGMGCGTGTGCGMPMAALRSAMGTQDGSLPCSAASPRVQLAILVHKINLLTSDISLHLSDAQAAGLVAIRRPPCKNRFSTNLTRLRKRSRTSSGCLPVLLLARRAYQGKLRIRSSGSRTPKPCNHCLTD